MPATSLPHLIRRGDIFYFRRAVPVNLTARLGRRELKVSLRTRDRVEALLRCRDCANAFDRMMAAVQRMSKVDPKEVNRLIRNYFEALLGQSEENVYLIRDDKTLDASSEADGADELRARYQAESSGNKFSGDTRSTAEELLIEAGIQKKDVGLDNFDDLCRGVLRARSEQMRITAAWLRGEFDEDKPKDLLFEGIESPGLPPLSGEQQSGPQDTVALVVASYISLRDGNPWMNKTTAENTRILGWFSNQVGTSRRIKDISAEDVRKFRDLIRRLPKSFANRKKYKDMALAQMAEQSDDDDKLSAGTQQKYLGIVKAFLRWCEDEYDLDMSAAIRIKATTKSKQQDDRHPFSSSQLTTIFSSPQYTGHRSLSQRSKPGDMIVRDGKFWLPLLGLMTGARLGELVQLLADDVVVGGDHTYIDINKGDDDSGKTLKTFSSQRKVPIHDELTKIGFLDYVAEKKALGSARLFPEIQPGKNGSWSHNASKHFGRYFRQIGVKTPKVAFHSFRHNFADALRVAGIEDSHLRALIGHADDSTTAIYGSGVPLPVLVEDMKKVTFPVKLEHLHSDESPT